MAVCLDDPLPDEALLSVVARYLQERAMSCTTL
jgi:hypothetical protein